jgi:voltage-gated sodium channel
MRSELRALLSSRSWEYFIITIILINAVTLGLEAERGLLSEFSTALLFVDRLILGVFVVELAARLYAFGPRFFRDPWSIFDLAIVGVALVPATGPFQIVRSLRVLRLLRLVSAVPSLKRVIGGLIAALPGMSSIVVLLVLLFYVAAVMATNLFGQGFPDWFGSLGASLYTLFQVMTLESWSMGIVRPVMEAYPWAWAFFVPFIVCSTYAVLNLFVGVIVSAMQEEAEAEAHAEREALRDDNEDLLAEIRALRAEITEVRQEFGALRDHPRSPTSG